MSKIFILLRKRNIVVSIACFFALFLVFYIIWTHIYYYFFIKYDSVFAPTPNETIMTLELRRKIVEVVVLAPLIETLIFQKWFYKLFSYIDWFNQYKILIILLSAVVFGLIHFYSLSYIIYNFFVGAFFMFVYIIKIGNRPYWTVAVLHGLMNLFSIYIDPIEKVIFNIR